MNFCYEIYSISQYCFHTLSANSFPFEPPQDVGKWLLVQSAVKDMYKFRKMSHSFTQFFLHSSGFYVYYGPLPVIEDA